jgi:hypothetical protein
MRPSVGFALGVVMGGGVLYAFFGDMLWAGAGWQLCTLWIVSLCYAVWRGGLDTTT